MAVQTIFGMTQSGKSFHAKKEILDKVDRCIIFDFVHCFSGGDVVKIDNASDVQKVFRKYSKRKKYKIIVKITKGANPSLVCDLVISLACALGKCLGSYNEKNRVWLVVDEADSVCSPHYQSKRLKYLVNYGRHDNVDSVFIARNPTRLHMDIRANASKVTTFNLSTALQVKDFVNNFGRENARQILTLPKYHRFEWEDTGKMAIYDEKGRETWSKSPV